MNNRIRRALAALFAMLALISLAGCYSDTEVQRTKLPHVDGSEKPAEKK